VRISITLDTISPELQRLIGASLRPRALYAAGAKSVQVQISEHLRALQARGNVKGWPAQKFFAGKATSVEKTVGISSLTDTGAVITIADPRFVHRIQGGPVNAKRGKYLAIPLTAEAYAASGKGSLRESMPGLVVIKFKRGLFLCRTVAGKGKVKGRVFPMFKLVRGVTHRAHPDEMPDPDKLAAGAQEAMFKAARSLFKAH